MWAIIANIIIGLWLMLSPSILSMPITSANNNYVCGPFIITFAVISLWAINKKVVKFNVLPGLWLLMAFFLFDYNTVSIISNGIAAILIIALSSLKQQSYSDDFGGGWRSLLQNNPKHLVESERQKRL